MSIRNLAASLVLSIAAAFLASTAPAAVPPVPVPPENPITEPKRILGKLLFWDEQLSSDNTVACGTCHQLERGGADARNAIHPGVDLKFGTADDAVGSAGVVRRTAAGQPIVDPLFGTKPQVTARNSPMVTGALWAPDLFFDGRARSTFIEPQGAKVSIAGGGALESQSVQPILASNEMASDGRTWSDVVARLSAVRPLALATYLPADLKAAVAANNNYASLFNAAFGTPAITAERIAHAIATYERTLVPDQTPFDTGTMTPLQQQGFNVFMAANANCNACHTAPLFTDNTFRNIGVRPIAEDPGRQVVTANPADAGRFKVPTLRNVGLKTFFMHNGQHTTLEQTVDFYLRTNGQVQFPDNIDPTMIGITIPGPQRASLVEFMRNGLTDPRVEAATFPFDQPILRSQRGDANRDGKVDAADRAAFVGCYAGAGKPAVAGCERVDLDGDLDVDCDDWMLFQAAWTGAAPPEPFAACAAVAGPAVIPALSGWMLLLLAMIVATIAIVVLRGNRSA